ncbi:MAG: hypothetical protein Q9186_002577 [Xanthomendoza sp. 1 TL-2023]
MSMLVRKPAQHDLRSATKTADVAVFEPFDYNHVRDKYPKADDIVVSRLGHGITRRRKYLKYRERHASKLKQGINHVTGDDYASSAGVLSETVVTDVQHGNINFQDNASESGFSQTSYAPTLVNGGDITIPSPPRASQGEHSVMESTCFQRSTALHMHEWVHHQRTIHPYEAPTQTLKEHRESHVCALCKEKQDTSERYERHVARHLQELALFILPRNDDESDEDERNALSDSDSSPESIFSEVDKFDPLQPTGEARDLKTDMLETKPDAMLRDGDKSDLSSESSVSKVIRINSDLAPAHDQPSSQLGEIGSSGQLSSIRRSNTGGSDSASNEDNPGIPYPREGMTKMRTKMVNIETLLSLGYRFTYEGDIVIVWEILGEEQIQEIFNLSKERNAKIDSAAHQTSEKKTEPSAEWENRDKEDTGAVEGYESEAKDHTDQRKTNESKRPRYTRVARKHVDPNILDAYGLPWEQDERDSKYIIIERKLTETDRAKLFEHTRELRVPELLGGGSFQRSDKRVAIVKEDKEESKSQLAKHDRPTYIRVHRKYLSPVTLEAFKLPWEWDDRNHNYLLIKQWINENDQDKLFEHTRHLRGQRLPDRPKGPVDRPKGPVDRSDEFLGERRKSH